MEEWCKWIPKIELHAHLNGSIRNSTLLELARELGDKGDIVFSEVEQVLLKNDRALSEVFKLFDLIHLVTTDHETVTRITKEVIEDFAADNVVYLELRTTPKRNDSKGMSKLSYVEAVLEGIKSVSLVEVCLADNVKVDSASSANTPPEDDIICNGTNKKKIYVGLLLSIDRRETAEAALQTVELALEMRHLGVVGIDVSGNPQVGEWLTFLPALEYAKKQGLPVTLNCGEVPNPAEIYAMLEFLPRRIGHACCFEEKEWELLKMLQIPVIFNSVEICLTSNIKTETITSLDVHHFADLYKSNHPLILCTDDSGVFSTSLSVEYALASSAFGLGKNEMFQLAKDAVKFIFGHSKVKKELMEIFDEAAIKLDL